MKKVWSAAVVSVILVVLVLSASMESRADSTALNFPDMEWGMTWEEVMAAGGIDEKDVVSDEYEQQYSSVYIVAGYEVFGEKSEKTNFDFIDLGGGEKRLINVFVQYPDDADMDHVLEEMTKAYGASVPELIDYDLFDPLDLEDKLPSWEYKESEQTKIWAGIPLGEVIPKEQDQEYMKKWQEKIYPSESSTKFQTGLTDEQWDEFIENARMARILWLNEADGLGGGNGVDFLAYNAMAFDEITRRISEQ